MFTTATGVVHSCSCRRRRLDLAWAAHRPTPADRAGPEHRDQNMREEYQADLIEVGRLLVTMAESVRAALRKATTALLTADLKAAEAVIERDVEVDKIYEQVE